MDMEKKSHSIQVMRGVAIIIVLLHHSISGLSLAENTALATLDSVLICVHMPIFFLIAGYLYEIKQSNNRNEFFPFVGGKAKRLLVPYAFWTILLWTGVQIGNMVAASFMEKIGFSPMGVRDLIINLMTYEVFYVELLWFLYVLFLYFVLHYLLGKYGKTRWFVLACIVAGLSVRFISYPNIINRFLLWSVFFPFGRLIAADKNVKGLLESGRKKTLLVAVGFVAVIVVKILLDKHELGIDTYVLRTVKQLLRYILGFLWAWLIYLFAKAERPRKKELRAIGDYSYDIYLMHNPYVVAVVVMVCGKIIKLPDICSVVIATILGIVIPIAVSKVLIRRSKTLSAIMLGIWRSSRDNKGQVKN